MEIKLAPSILSADFAHLADDIVAIADESDWIHVDVMDGHFVPNLTIGPVVVSSVRRVTDLRLDCHLMIESPSSYYAAFADSGADSITFHREAVEDPASEIRAIRALGMRAGMAINPETTFEEAEGWLEALDLLLVMSVNPGFGGQSFMPEVLMKVTAARDVATRDNLDLDIEVDGGVSEVTARAAVVAGASVLVAGSAIFSASEPVEAARSIRKSALSARS